MLETVDISLFCCWLLLLLLILGSPSLYAWCNHYYSSELLTGCCPGQLAGCLSVCLAWQKINTGNNKQTSTKFCIPAMLIGTNYLCPFVSLSVSLTLAKTQNVKANHLCWKFSNICQLIMMNFDVVQVGHLDTTFWCDLLNQRKWLLFSGLCQILTLACM